MLRKLKKNDARSTSGSGATTTINHFQGSPLGHASTMFGRRPLTRRWVILLTDRPNERSLHSAILHPWRSDYWLSPSQCLILMSCCRCCMPPKEKRPNSVAASCHETFAYYHQDRTTIKRIRLQQQHAAASTLASTANDTRQLWRATFDAGE